MQGYTVFFFLFLVLNIDCGYNFFVLLAPYMCYRIFSKVYVIFLPPIGKIAAHSATICFHGLST